MHVLPAFGDMPVASVSHTDVRRFVADTLGAGLAPGTVSGARKVLRLVLQEALRADAIRRNPCDGVRVPRSRREEMVFLSPPEIHALGHAITHQPRPNGTPSAATPSTGC